MTIPNNILKQLLLQLELILGDITAASLYLPNELELELKKKGRRIISIVI
jgi:hypothetical protein